MYPLISMKQHLLLDAVMGGLLAASPWADRGGGDGDRDVQPYAVEADNLGADVAVTCSGDRNALIDA